jgi:hypothetical protein
MSLTLTQCPSPALLRRDIERYILDLYESDGVTLKDQAFWPGEYVLADGNGSLLGTIIPAVYVVGAQMVPSEWKIKGIECVIEDVPQIRNPGSLGAVVSFEEWRVRFTNYGLRETTRVPFSMLDIARRIARTFPDARSEYLPRTEATFEGLVAYITGHVLNPPIP